VSRPDPNAGTNLDHVLARRAQYLAALDRHYGTEAHSFGIRSSFEPLAQIAQSGFGGSPDPERNITDRMFRFAGSETTITVARRIHAALLALSTDPDAQALYSNALFLAHGSPTWQRALADVYGVKEAGRTIRRLGNVTPVVGLTAEALQGHADEPGHCHAGAWVVSLCQDPSEPAKQRCERIRAEAVAILASAEAAYLVACGLALPTQGKRKAKPKPERPVYVVSQVGALL
jgi:hypothetical protein